MIIILFTDKMLRRQPPAYRHRITYTDILLVPIINYSLFLIMIYGFIICGTSRFDNTIIYICHFGLCDVTPSSVSASRIEGPVSCLHRTAWPRHTIHTPHLMHPSPQARDRVRISLQGGLGLTRSSLIQSCGQAATQAGSRCDHQAATTAVGIMSEGSNQPRGAMLCVLSRPGRCAAYEALYPGCMHALKW